MYKWLPPGVFGRNWYISFIQFTPQWWFFDGWYGWPGCVSFRLMSPSRVFMFTAELTAICVALIQKSFKTAEDYVILTDSLSSIRAMESHSLSVFLNANKKYKSSIRWSSWSGGKTPFRASWSIGNLQLHVIFFQMRRELCFKTGSESNAWKILVVLRTR
jgi:hypothetical protein